jgi:prolipoprotein diacylglyceryltransferase
MIPNVNLGTVSVGPLHLHPFGLLLVAGIIAAHTALVRLARGLAAPAVVEGFALALGAGGVLATLVASNLGAGSIASVAAAAGALVAGAIYVIARDLDGARFADAAAGAFPYGWALARLGCALVHDHLGPPSRSWLAVALPTGPRLDLGLCEWLLTPLLFVAANLGRRSGQPGKVAGAVGLTYAAIRFPLDFLRIDDARHAGLTAAQWASLLLTVAGIGLLVRPVKATR